VDLCCYAVVRAIARTYTVGMKKEPLPWLVAALFWFVRFNGRGIGYRVGLLGIRRLRSSMGISRDTHRLRALGGWSADILCR
jgi:hypothetical protein